MASPLNYRVSVSSGIFILLAGLFAASLGVVLSNPAAFACGSVLILLPLGVRSFLRRTAEHAQIFQSGPEAVIEGDPVEIRIRVVNTGRQPLFYPRFIEVFGPENNTQKEVVFPDRVLGGEAVELPYFGRCEKPRGYHEYGPSAFCLADPLGWFEVRRPLRATWRLKVYPRVDRQILPEQLGESLLTQDGGLARPRRGLGADFFGVREFRAGDPVRHIHAALSARRARPIVKVFSPETRGDLSVFLDTSREAAAGTLGQEVFEAAIRIAAALAARAVETRNRLQIFADAGGPHSLRFRTGPTPLVEVLDLLVEVQPGTGEGLGELLTIVPAETLALSTVVLILPAGTLRQPGLFASIRGLRRRGQRVVAVLVHAEVDRAVVVGESRRLRASGAEIWFKAIRSNSTEGSL